MVAFSKKLKSTDVGRRFSWPTAFLHLLPPFHGGDVRVHFTAVDAGGKAWAFTCSTRKHGPHLKPVLDGSSWLPFIREKKLSLDDVVIFYRDQNQPIGFRIRVRKLKTIKLFGHLITGYAKEE